MELTCQRAGLHFMKAVHHNVPLYLRQPTFFHLAQKVPAKKNVKQQVMSRPENNAMLKGIYYKIVFQVRSIFTLILVHFKRSKEVFDVFSF